MIPPPEATAVSVARCLAASRGRAASSSQEKNAERDVGRLFERHNLSLPIPTERMDHEVIMGLERSLQTHHVKPENWLRFLMQEDPSLLCGVSGDVRLNNQAFWKAYSLQHASHAVFQRHGSHLGDVLPVFIHGDEGRGKKKTGYLVVSFETPFGSTKRPKPACSCAQYLASRPDLPTFGVCNDRALETEWLGACRGMYTNYRGHSYLTRFLLFGLGKSVYKFNPHVLQKLLEETADEFCKLFTSGVQIPGYGVLFAAVVGIKGDLDFHSIYFNLERCYAKVATRHNVGYICHSCNAASGVLDPRRDCSAFEDFGDEPEWRHSLFRTRPWSQEPALARIPFDVHGAQERMLIPDPFHVVKIGIARDLIGGLIILLARKGFWDFEGSTRNMDDRLVRAQSSFFLFAAVRRERPALRAFTKAFFHIKNQLSAPYANSKGGDSMLLLRWLRWFLRLNLQDPVVSGYDQVLRLALYCCDSVLDMFQLVHSHKLWLERSCATVLYIHIMRLLRSYKLLGQRSIRLHVRAFMLKPKTHALHHIAYTLKSQLEGGSPLVLNPESAGCEPNEDYIGRVSRLSRKVGAQVVDLRVIQRVFLKTRKLHERRRAQ